MKDEESKNAALLPNFLVQKIFNPKQVGRLNDRMATASYCFSLQQIFHLGIKRVPAVYATNDN